MPTTPNPPNPSSPPKALILTAYGAYVRRLGGWLAVADLVELLGALGQREPAVRSATSRMKKGGLLRAESRGPAAGYALTDEAAAILDAGDERIFMSSKPADLSEGWVMAVFSVPERHRDQRHQLRSQLAALGFGQAAPGVWIAPRRVGADTRRVLQRHGLAGYVTLFEGDHIGFDDTRSLIARSWDLGDLASSYRRFFRRFEPVRDAWRGRTASDRTAYVDYTLALSAWRRLPYLDPGLPPELLPADWPGAPARQLFAELVERLDDRALAHVRAVVERIE
ncbi:MAG: PaaX family transcriptional regulator [Acidimicrobiales bacterium]